MSFETDRRADGGSRRRELLSQLPGFLAVGIRRRPLALILVALFSLAAILPICNRLFACGCTVLWAGGESACNIHNAQPPHCPWCVLGTAPVVLISTVFFFTTQVALAGWTTQRGWNTWIFFLLGIALLGVLALVAGFVARSWTGYPFFIIGDVP